MRKPDYTQVSDKKINQIHWCEISRSQESWHTSNHNATHRQNHSFTSVHHFANLQYCSAICLKPCCSRSERILKQKCKVKGTRKNRLKSLVNILPHFSNFTDSLRSSKLLLKKTFWISLKSKTWGFLFPNCDLFGTCLSSRNTLGQHVFKDCEWEVAAGASHRDSPARRQRMSSKTQCWVHPLPEPSPASAQVPCFRYNNQALFHPLPSAPRGARAVNNTSHVEQVPLAVITLTLLPPSTSSWCKNSLGSNTILIWPQSNPSFSSCSLCL